MADDVFANLAGTTVSSGGTTAPAPGTTETWVVASNAGWPTADPTATPPTQFHVAEDDMTRQSEVVLVTDSRTTSWAVTRGAEGSTPVIHPVGFSIVQTVPASALNNFVTSTILADRDVLYWMGMV